MHLPHQLSDSAVNMGKAYTLSMHASVQKYVYVHCLVRSSKSKDYRPEAVVRIGVRLQISHGHPITC